MRRLLYLILCICVIAGITGCSRNVNVPAEIPSMYTNMASETAQSETRTRMERAGIGIEQINRLMDWIDQYNEIMENITPLQGDYIETDTSSRPDYATLYSTWWKDRDYYDILCRHVAFELLRDVINIDKPLTDDLWDTAPAIFDEKDNELIVIDEGGWLQSDMDVVKDGHFFNWEQETTKGYYTLYNPVPVKENTRTADWAEEIKNAWKNYGVTFQASKLSLITVWILDGQTNRLCIAHAGVLIEDSDGLLFLEKTDPLYPYQASTYQDIEDFASSLLLARDAAYAEYDEQNVQMLIMRNNEEIKLA